MAGPALHHSCPWGWLTFSSATRVGSVVLSRQGAVPVLPSAPAGEGQGKLSRAHGPQLKLGLGPHLGPRWQDWPLTIDYSFPPSSHQFSLSLSLHNAQAIPLLFLFHLTSTHLHIVVVPAVGRPRGWQMARIPPLPVPCGMAASGPLGVYRPPRWHGNRSGV